MTDANSGIQYFRMPSGGVGWLHWDADGSDLVLHLPGTRLELKDSDTLRIEIFITGRPQRTHVLADRAKLFPSR
jgi:hypothetical protein